MYDKNNPFAKILRKELPCKSVYENENNLAFWSIEPKAPVHILVIPKGEYIGYEDFSQKATTEEVISFHRTIVEVAKIMNLADGYRVIFNIGKNSGQSVFHLHAHILGKIELKDGL